MIETYAEYGAIGVIVFLFVMMIMNLIKSQKAQNEDLDQIRQAIAKSETKMGNVESIVLKLVDRWNRSDETSQRHREDIVKELNDVTDDLAYLKGRINGKVADHDKKLTSLWSYGVAFVFVASVCINLIMRSF